jgi:hypothetical protein
MELHSGEPPKNSLLAGLKGEKLAIALDSLMAMQGNIVLELAINPKEAFVLVSTNFGRVVFDLPMLEELVDAIKYQIKECKKEAGVLQQVASIVDGGER